MWKRSKGTHPVGYDAQSESTDASPPAGWAWLAFATLAVVVAFALLTALPFLPPKKHNGAPPDETRAEEPVQK